MGTTLACHNGSTECEVSAIDLYQLLQWLMEICSWRVLNHDDLTIAGNGPVHVVEIEVWGSIASLRSHTCTHKKPNNNSYCLFSGRKIIPKTLERL